MEGNLQDCEVMFLAGRKMCIRVGTGGYGRSTGKKHWCETFASKRIALLPESYY